MKDNGDKYNGNLRYLTSRNKYSDIFLLNRSIFIFK